MTAGGNYGGTKPVPFVLALYISLVLVGCSQTPGDAALRAGHPQNAAELYRKGADQGDARAAFKLCVLVGSGRVRQSDYGTAGQWCVKACDLGDVVGCHNVGVGYEYGRMGFPKDYSLAKDFYLRAANKGYSFSQYNLGSMYANRYFSDDKEGYRWMMIARQSAAKCAAQGDRTCQWLLDDPPGHVKRLADRLSERDRREIEAAAKDWKPAVK